MALIGKRRTKESRCERMEKMSERNGLRPTTWSPTGDHYTGEWRNHMRHGRGTQVWRRAGLMYQGEWRSDLRHGFGTLYKLQPSSKVHVKIYSGSWRFGKRGGLGKSFYGSRGFYEGQWVEDMRSGWGRMEYENGDVYEGQWIRDKPHGQGVLQLQNGHRYEGGMKEGKKHGQGRFIYKDKGQVYEGTWVEDIPRRGVLCEYKSKKTHTPHLDLPPPPGLQDDQGGVKKEHGRPRPMEKQEHGPRGTAGGREKQTNKQTNKQTTEKTLLSS